MAINLQKGQTIDLRKNAKGDNVYDLSRVTIGLGWDVRQKKKGFLDKLMSSNEEEYDLDAIAFLLDSNGKVADADDIVFFGQLNHPSGQIWLTGDNRTGAGEGDDEQIIVKLNSLDEKYQKILFVVTIYEGLAKNQHFNMVENAFIRAVDAKANEVTKYSLSGDESLSGMCAMVFSELYRKDGAWKFRAIGEPYRTDNFTEILKKYTYS